MKTFKHILPFLLALLVLAGCEDDVNYTQGTAENPDCYGVYFPKKQATRTDLEFEPGTQTEATYTVKRRNTVDPIVVPVVVKSNVEDIFVVEPIAFDAGEDETTFTISFPKAQMGTTYTCDINIEDPRYASIYGADKVNLSISLVLAKWELVTDEKTGETKGRYRDDILGNFASIDNPNANPNPEIELEIYERSDKKGYYRMKAYTPELMNIFREVADVQTADMLDLDVPALRGGKPIIVESEPDWYVKQVMEEFVVRAERIRGGGVDPSVDNFLKITHEARLLGTDARLIDKDAPNNPDGKLNKVAENVWKEYVKGNADGHIGCQLIFSDIGTPGPDKDFTIYDYLKESLIKYGIPAEEIAFIHDAKTDAQRDALFKEMRTGKKKVLIGSTDKCGTGVNVQTHLVAMHHVDCPWKPSSIEQREGRGIRQGNKNDEVAIYRYVTKQTFDAYNWSLVENKQRFISQVMTSKAVSRSCEDIDEATLSYAEIKAVATGNPLIREKMEVDNDVQRLKLLKASYDNQRYGLQDNFMIKYPKLIKTATEKLANVREDIKARDKELIDNPDFAITIGNATYTERVDGGTVMLEAISKCKTGETTPVGKFHGFELLVEKNFLSINYMVLRGKTEYKAELSTSPVGSMVKLENLFNGLHENVDFLEKKIEQYQNDLEASKAEYDKPFAYSAELEEKLARQYELNAQLDLENAKAMDADLGGPDEEKSEDRIENAGIVAEDKGIYMPDRNRKR